MGVGTYVSARWDGMTVVGVGVLSSGCMAMNLSIVNRKIPMLCCIMTGIPGFKVGSTISCWNCVSVGI